MFLHETYVASKKQMSVPIHVEKIIDIICKYIMLHTFTIST